jgi:hypothetical protein
MQVSLDGSAFGWEAITAHRDMTLPPGDASHTVSVQFKDKIGNLSQVYDQGIGLDTVAPQAAALPLPPAFTGQNFTVHWNGQDAAPASGIKTYDVQYRVGPAGTWTDWLVGTPLTAAAFGPLSPVKLTNGATYYFRVRATDQAGNVGVYAGGDGDTHVTVTVTNNYYVFLPVVTK